MKISKQKLIQEASATDFRPEILEKVWHLMALLDAINDHSFLKERLVLKGGTALNLFIFDLPRLSVDIDLNYIGSIEKEVMLLERSLVDRALEAIFKREDLIVRRVPVRHAGGKWQLKYESALGGFGNLEVDLNYMFRVPFYDIQKRRSHFIGSQQTQEISLLHLYELGAGKLSALFHRQASRDLFDAHELLTKQSIDYHEFRIVALLYGVMGTKDWRKISVEDIQFDQQELKHQLVPVLRKSTINKADHLSIWTSSLITGCKNVLNRFMPFSDNESAFLNQLYDHGVVDATIIASNQHMIQKINSHPLLKWKTQLIAKNKL